MRKLVAFLVWLFSFWTWKDSFLRWLRSPASHPASGETSEHLPSREGQPESEFARFLSSLPEDERRCNRLQFIGDSEVNIGFGRFKFQLSHGTGVQASHREFLEAVASSEIVFREEVHIGLLGDGSCKHMEAFADALRQSGNRFRTLDLQGDSFSAVRFAKCVSSVLLGNDAIQDLHLQILYPTEAEMGHELAAEFMAIIAGPHILRILKSFRMGAPRLDGAGMEQLMKPFRALPAYWKTCDFMVEHPMLSWSM